MTRIGPTDHLAPEIRWDEYEHFRAFRWDHDRIARRLGVDPASLSTALSRRAAKDARKEKVA